MDVYEMYVAAEPVRELHSKLRASLRNPPTRLNPRSEEYARGNPYHAAWSVQNFRASEGHVCERSGGYAYTSP